MFPQVSDTWSIVDNVVSILEGTLDEDMSKQSNIEKLEECIFYLKQYGNPISFIEFSLKYNKEKEACLFCLEQKIDKQIFLEYLVEPNFLKGNLTIIRDVIFQNDPKLELYKDYVSEICKFLNTKNELKELVIFLLFMKDYYRAGVTCIKMLIAHSQELSIEEKAKLLNVAKYYFLEACKISTINSEIDNAKKYIDRIDLQVELLYEIKENTSDSIYFISLFGTKTEQREIICFLILKENWTLAQKNFFKYQNITRIFNR